MKGRAGRAKRTAAAVALALGLLGWAWSLALSLAVGFDLDVAGVRVRSNDAFRPAFWGAIALVTFWLLRRPTRPASPVRAPWATRLRAAWPIILILTTAAVVRVWALAFGLPTLVCRPDEEAIASISGSYLEGNLQTHVFTYPPFYMLVVAAVVRVLEIAQDVLARFGVPTGMEVTRMVPRFFIARAISAAAGVATVGVLFGVGGRLFDVGTGLTAAACLALAFLHVRDSHFGVTDVPMTFMLVVAFFGVVKLALGGTRRDLVGAAVLAGLATATKYNAALIFIPGAFAILTNWAGGAMGERLRQVALFVAVMVLTFLLIAPFSLVEPRLMFTELRRISAHLSGGHGPDLGLGWTYHMTTTLRYGLGLPLLVAGLAGLVILIVRRPRIGLLVALFPAVYYAIAGNGYTVFTRHMQPVVPFLCLSAGYAISEAGRWLARLLRRPSWTPAATAIAAGLVLAPSARAVVQFDRLLARTDTRVLARRWLDANVAPGATIAQSDFGAMRVLSDFDEEPRFVNIDLAAANSPPDVVIIQTSPLHGPERNAVGETFIATGYDLRLTLTASRHDPANLYDRQDDFYLPMSGFRQIERPGPNVQIYVRRR